MQPHPIQPSPCWHAMMLCIYTFSKTFPPSPAECVRCPVASIRPGPSFTFKSKVVGIDLGGATAAQPGPGETRPGQQPVVPRLRTGVHSPVVSVVSVVPSCPSNSGPLLLQDEKSSSVGHLYTLCNRGRAAKWLLFWNHKRL